MDFDKVAVMDSGRLIEFDSPYTLLDVPESSFSRLYNAAMAEEDEVEFENMGDVAVGQGS